MLMFIWKGNKVEKELYELHLNAGEKAGEERTCGKKVKYNSEETAVKSADSMNKKPTTRRELEAYPCYFCKNWHIGGKMPVEVLRSFIAGVKSS